MEDEDQHLIRMPSIMNASTGIIDKWNLSEGDKFVSGEVLCEATIGDLMIGIETESEGILVKKMVSIGTEIKVNEPIAVYVDDKQAYFNFFADQKEIADQEEMMHDVEETEVKADAKTMLREIKHMISEGVLDHDAEFTKKMISLARKNDSELLTAFEASYEGLHFNPMTFDRKFFLEGVTQIIEERGEIES